MKIRRKPTTAKSVSAPSRRGAHLRPFHFKPGQSGNPAGRPKGAVGITSYLRRALNGLPKGTSAQARYENLAEQISDIIVEQARDGKFQFVEMLIEKSESRQITEDDMRREIEKVFTIVSKHVKNKTTLAAIAHDLKLDKEEDE